MGKEKRPIQRCLPFLYQLHLSDKRKSLDKFSVYCDYFSKFYRIVCMKNKTGVTCDE